MGRSRSRSLSRKKSHRRSSSRSKHSKKSRHRTPEKKSSKYRHRSGSSSSTERYISSSKYKSKRQKRRDSRSPSSSHRRHRGRRSSSSSSSSSSSRSSQSSGGSSDSKNTHKPSSSYVDKIRAMRTPTPPPSKQNFEASLEFLDKRHVSDAIDEVNANEFRPKAFNSSANNKNDKSDADVIKIKGETKANKTDSNDDPLFHQKVKSSDIFHVKCKFM